jgi:hypothetical protein
LLALRTPTAKCASVSATAIANTPPWNASAVTPASEAYPFGDGFRRVKGGGCESGVIAKSRRLLGTDVICARGGAC